MSCFSPVPLTLYKDSYRDRQTEDEENEYVVVTKGNNITSVERVSDYAILRAAQLMKEEGFEYFVVSKEVKDFAVVKALGVSAGDGYYTTGIVDVRNPVKGLLITGHNEKPELENKRSKIYKTDDILKEYGHYINEERPKEFDPIKTTYLGLGAGLVAMTIWLYVIIFDYM
jgi:hypothetical protein